MYMLKRMVGHLSKKKDVTLFLIVKQTQWPSRDFTHNVLVTAEEKIPGGYIKKPLLFGCSGPSRQDGVLRLFIMAEDDSRVQEISASIVSIFTANHLSVSDVNHRWGVHEPADRDNWR
jgi:hypothetical protein